jgi:hypothetical protein
LTRPPGHEVVARLVPDVEIVAPGPQADRPGGDPAVRGDDRFSILDEDRAFFAGRLGLAAEDAELGLLVASVVHPIKPFIEDVKRGVGGMDLDILLPVEAADAEKQAPGEEVELRRVIFLSGQADHVDLGVPVEAKEIAPAELDFGPAVAGPDLVSLDDDQVDFTLFEAEVLGPLDVHVALDVAQARVAAVVVSLGLAENESGDRHDQGRRDDQGFLHRLSPSAPL